MSRSSKMFKKIFIANRGEIACRAIRPCRELGIKEVVGYSDCDELSLHVKMADEAVRLGPSAASQSYLDQGRIIEAALETKCEAIFPGYGFLAENADFAQACEDAGLVFIGPPPGFIRLMGDKINARKALKKAGVPVVPGLEKVTGPDEVVEFGRKKGWPIMIKARAGGGGKGIRIVHNEDDVEKALSAAQSIAGKAFGNDEVYVEKFIDAGRHIEFQYISDRFGNVVHLGDRECSIQRKHQKLVEEAPSSIMTEKLRKEMGSIVVKAIKKFGYASAGTIEFLIDRDMNYYALEVNTRIQVEHTVTEMVIGYDIIRMMIKLAAGNKLKISQKDIKFNHHAIQCRVNAEDPKNNFTPSSGKITYLRQVSGPFVRAETGIYQGWVVPPFYDSLICKVCSMGKDRITAIERMARSLREFTIRGVKTTVPLMRNIISNEDFISGNFDTSFISKNLRKLLSYPDEEDEVYKIGTFIAKVSALGENPYCK